MAAENIHANELKVVYDFFKKFPSWCGPSPETPTVEELEKFFSKEVQMFNNGKLIVQGGSHYLERLKNFQKMYSSFKISDPLEEPLIHENRASIYYTLDLTTHNGEHKQIYIMALFTIENHKIRRWVEVTHEKNSQKWDS
ncbi:MAG: hypothetical protein WDZ27_01730 [Waddliaceae bacterium]